ncbi:hypothetical protein GCM10022214_67670 [Actinomadura miaoliensis]|uniref:Uncharacterized protein n=1 Tax=Actinomadura miaoliensis TaxID=430685 RepID=A0ABP7WSD0_9ACTN
MGDGGADAARVVAPVAGADIATARPAAIAAVPSADRRLTGGLLPVPDAAAPWRSLWDGSAADAAGPALTGEDGPRGWCADAASGGTASASVRGGGTGTLGAVVGPRRGR